MTTPASLTTCSRCGAERAEAARFCPTCGLDFSKPTDETYELGGAGGMGLPVSRRGWLVFGVIFVVLLVAALLGFSIR